METGVKIEKGWQTGLKVVGLVVVSLFVYEWAKPLVKKGVAKIWGNTGEVPASAPKA